MQTWFDQLAAYISKKNTIVAPRLCPVCGGAKYLRCLACKDLPDEYQRGCARCSGHRVFVCGVCNGTGEVTDK